MSDSIKSVMNVQASRVNLNPSVVLRKLSDVEVLRKTTPERLRKTGKERASVSTDTDESLDVHEVQSRSGSDRKQDTQRKVEVTKPHPKSTEENHSKEKPSKATEVDQKKVAKPVNENKAQYKPTESSVIDSVKESVKEVVDQEAAMPSRSTITEDLLTQISLSAPVKDVEKVVQVLSSDNITEKSDKTEGKRKLMAKDSQKVSTSKEAEGSSKMATVMTESRNLSVVVPKLPKHISPQKSYNINDPSITPSKVKPRSPTAKEALARKMVKKAKSRANGKGSTLSFKRLMGDNGNLDNSSDFVETGKTFQPAVRKLRSRIVKKTAKDKVGKPASPDTTVAKEKGTVKTSSMPVDVEGKEGKTCLTCKQTIFGTEETVKEHMRTCLRQRFVLDKHSSKQTRLRHLPEPSSEPAEEGSMELEVSDDESFARHLQQREDDKLMEEQLTDAEFYFCQICGRDLTHLNTVRRTQHINRCIDAMETEKKLHAEENVKDVPDCPICGKVLESRAQRQSHLKRCAVQYGVTTVQLLDLVKKQEAEMVRRKNQPRPRLQPGQLQQRGIKRHHEGPAGTAGKRPRKPARPVVSSRLPPGEGAPYREMDERTQVAMAMSMSLVKNDESGEQPTVMSALPVAGKEVKRRKKAAKTGEVPALLLTSKEDRDKTLARKVASIIVQGDQESRPKTPSMRKSKLGRKYHTARKTMGKALSSPGFLQKAAAATTSSPPAAPLSTAASPASSQEKAPLWSMSKRIDEKKTDDFYVQELSKQITPAKYVPVTPMRKAAKKAMMTFKKKSETDTSESETPDISSTQKSVTGSQKARKTPTSPRTPVRKARRTPTLTQRETASVLAELAEEGCSTQEVQDVFTEGQALSPEPSGFVPDRTTLSPQKMPSSVLSTALTKLSADFLGMVNSPKLSDLNLLCRNGEVLHVHKFVLVARCPVIAKMLETSKGDLAALDFSDHHKDAVLTTLQYLYGGKVALNGTVLAANVMRVAQKLELKELEDSCQAFLNTTFSPAASSPEFQEKELPELLDTMLGSPNSSPNLSQGSVNQSSDFNDSELEDIALSQKQRFQNPKITPSKNVNKEPAVTKKPTQMVPPAGRGLGQAPETQESGLHVPTMTVGDIVDSAIEKNVKQHASIGPDASATATVAYQQPLLASTGQTTSVRIPVEHSYSTSPRKGTQRGRRGPKTTVRPMMEGYATTVSPVKPPASLAPSMQGIATTVTPSPRGSATTVTSSTHAVTSTTTLSSSQLGVGTAVTQASPTQTAMGVLGAYPRPGVREQSLIFQSQELSSKLCCLECEKLGVRVSADEAQMLIQGGPAANAMRQLILARQGPCPHGKFPSWGPAVATTWTPPQAPESVQGRAAGHLLAGLRTRTPPSSPVRQTAVVTTSAPGHIPTNPAHGHARGPPGPRMQNFAETRSPPFVPGLGRLAVPSMPPRPGGPQPDMRLPVPGSRMPVPPLPGFGMLPPGGRLPPASSLLPRTNILAQLREPSQYAQQRYGPQGVVQEPYPPQRKFPSPRDPTISPKSAQRSGKELDSPPTLSQGRSSPSTRLLLHTAQMMLPGNQYLSSPFFSPPGMQRPALHDGTPRLSVVAESSPPKNTSTAVVRIPAPTEKSQDRSERHISPPPAAVPTTAGGHVSNLTTSPSLDSTRRMPVRSSGGATFSSASLNSSTADMFAVPDTPPSSGRPRRRQGDKRGRGRTPSESDNDTRSAAEALMFMSQRREDSDGSEDVTPSPPEIPGPNTKRRRGKATTAATTLPSSSSATMSPHSSDASPMLRGTVEIVVNPGRGRSATGRQEPDIGKVPSIFDNSQENQVTIPNDQGNYRVTRRASQRKKQTTPTEDVMSSSQATDSVQTRSKGGKQKDEGKVTPSPTKRLRMRRPPEGKRHACTQSPKKFWTDYLKAQLASGYAPAGPVGESMMQTPDLSAVKPVRRGISSPELALTTPGVAGSTALQPKFSTPVGTLTQPVVSPRLSLDQELKEAETETVSHGTITEPAAPALENKRETSLDSTDSQQADGASKGGEQKEAAVTDSSVTPGKLQEASSNLNDSFTSTESEGSSVTRPGQLFVKTVQEGPAVIVQTQSELLSPTIDFHEETIVPRSVSPTPPQSPLTTVRSGVSSTASPPASPVIGPTPGQGQGSLLTGGSEIKSKDTPAAADEVIELSDDDDDDVQEREDLQDDAKRKRSTPDSESEAKRPKTDDLESSVDEKDADHAESVADNSVDDDVGLEDVEKIDLTQEPADEAASESQHGVCGTEHGCGTPEPEQPSSPSSEPEQSSSPSSQSKPAEEQQSQNSHPSVVNDSFMDFFDDGGYMEVPFGGEVECAADSSDDKINLSGVTSKTGGKDDQNTDDLNLSLDALPTKDSHTTPSSVPLSPKNTSTVIEEFPDTQQEPVHVEEDPRTEQDVAEVVEESTSVGEDVVNNSMYDLEPYHEDNFWDESNEPQMDEPATVQGVAGGVVGSGDTGTGAVKSTPLQTHPRSKAPLVPITPMPDYPNMETPELKKQVGKYGVRALKKPQMVAKLTEIYQYTHQLETDSEEDTPSAERTSDNHAELQHNRLYNRQTVIHEVPRIGEVVETVPCTDAAPGGSDVDSDGSTDSNSEGEEYEELSDDDDDVTPSQQVDGGSLKGQLLHWVQDNKELYQKILQYEPIDAENLQQTLKSAGIRCSKNQLLDFLDEQCITFILPSSREKRLKKPRRKRKKKTPPAAAAVV
ncbi:SLX4 [Branchiostoma lanceolatum]|uniref:Structure-specific endonuclease subunit SLX4 n=1 Tax=Branchiostoma lanceolatum TaxID=7740 RepID=A0A8K0A6L9_BRALA|nr:SLX4 [Branchiostoma lanceolatum]